MSTYGKNVKNMNKKSKNSKNISSLINNNGLTGVY